MRRSLTIDVANTQNNNDQKKIGILVERSNPNNIIIENDEFINNIQLTEQDKRVSCATQMDVEENLEFDKFDIMNKDNPQVVACVVKEIFTYLKSIEVKIQIFSNFKKKIV